MTRSAGSRTRRSAKACYAIYTRKSSKEGLDQEFNSLQAEREACEAFINSQRHEGWVCLPTCYNDGGFSGATMDRPALQRLLAAITARRVDIVVVYKIDRLTRSLADFTKIVEIFDAQHGSTAAASCGRILRYPARRIADHCRLLLDRVRRPGWDHPIVRHSVASRTKARSVKLAPPRGS